MFFSDLPAEGRFSQMKRRFPQNKMMIDAIFFRNIENVKPNPDHHEKNQHPFHPGTAVCHILFSRKKRKHHRPEYPMEI